MFRVRSLATCCLVAVPVKKLGHSSRGMEVAADPATQTLEAAPAEACRHQHRRWKHPSRTASRVWRRCWVAGALQTCGRHGKNAGRWTCCACGRRSQGLTELSSLEGNLRPTREQVASAFPSTALDLAALRKPLGARRVLVMQAMGAGRGGGRKQQQTAGERRASPPPPSPLSHRFRAIQCRPARRRGAGHVCRALHGAGHRPAARGVLCVCVPVCLCACACACARARARVHACMLRSVAYSRHVLLRAASWQNSITDIAIH